MAKGKLGFLFCCIIVVFCFLHLHDLFDALSTVLLYQCVVQKLGRIEVVCLIVIT